MTYVVRNAMVGAQPIATSSTVQNHTLGEEVQAGDPTYGSGTFIYLKGVASTAVGSWVKYNPDDFTTSLLLAGDDGNVAVAMSTNVANQYGWYQVIGKAVGKALASFADNTDVYCTSTAGSVDDAYVGGDLIVSAKGASAIDTPSTGLAEFEINRPIVLGSRALDGGAEVVTATNVITEAESGKTFFLNSATEFVSTLPAPALGLRYTFIVSAAPSGASYTIVTNGSANIIKGHVLTSDVNSATDADLEVSGGDTISFVDAKAVAGDRVDVECDGTSWFARASCTVFDAITITTAS